MNLINLIFPKKCAYCGEFTGDGAFCGICAAKYEQIKRAPCRECGLAHSLCRCKAVRLRGEERASCRHLFAYDGDFAKAIIYKLKRKNVSSLQKFFARELALLIEEEMHTGEDCIISYAPRAEKAVREYGFDQAEILAREAAKKLSLTAADIFVRERSANVQQKTLGAKEREENANASFSLMENVQLNGKTIFLIDDVCTTGSTVARLSELALGAGAERIAVITVAKA